jgi:micrococcal nuclease
MIDALLHLLLSFIVTLLGSTPPDAPTTSTIVGITDGDTVTVQDSGQNYTLRLVGVDTPETYGSVHPQEFGVSNATCLNRWADKASDYTSTRLHDQDVQLKYDTEAGTKGVYDRYLAEVHLNGTNFNTQLLRQGYARYYSEGEYSSMRAFRYRGAEAAAQESGEGVWSCR